MHSLTTKKSESTEKIPITGPYTILYDKDYLKIYISANKSYLKIDWFGLPTQDNIMIGCEQILELVKKYGCKKIINDVSQVDGPFTYAVDWVVQNFSPRLNASGVDFVAWIYSESSESRKSADAIVCGSITDTIIIVFDNLENAERWIMAV